MDIKELMKMTQGQHDLTPEFYQGIVNILDFRTDLTCFNEKM